MIENASERDYVWECGCGERYLEESHAWACRKCLIYLTDADFLNRTVKNLFDNQQDS